jgi:hypothetical protein
MAVIPAAQSKPARTTERQIRIVRVNQRGNFFGKKQEIKPDCTICTIEKDKLETFDRPSLDNKGPRFPPKQKPKPERKCRKKAPLYWNGFLIEFLTSAHFPCKISQFSLSTRKPAALGDLCDGVILHEILHNVYAQPLFGSHQAILSPFPPTASRRHRATTGCLKSTT